MKKIFPFLLIIFWCATVFAQKQSFDVVSFTVPKGWQQKQNEGSVQLLASDKKTNAYIMAIITNASPSNATAIENFNSKWKAAIKDQIQLDGEPTMQPSSNDNGWDIETGSAIFTDNGAKGNVALLSATGGGQTLSVVIMYNSNQYEKELAAFLNSLELSTLPENKPATTTQPPNINHTANSSIVGLWADYVLETTGNYINGQPQYTAGYLRKEYSFNTDGTYIFRNKQWLTKAKDILFIYENGTYTVSGNQIILSPKNGKGEFWSKTTSSKEWGKLVKSSEYKLEKVTYSFEIIKDPNYGNSIVLKPGKPTQRDGGKFNAPNDPYEFRYKNRGDLGSLIDNPPGLKTGFENKSFAAATSPSKNTTTVNTVNSPLAGKIWEGTTTEKSSSGTTNSYNTGGFWKYQYKFNTDGTYQFVYNAASALANNPVNVLQYETGTYKLNGNQVTISPLKGVNEEWSVGDINNGMSAEHIRDVLETRLKQLKTTERKLETITYPFTVEFWQGNNVNALCLKHTQNTIREGSPGQNNQSCFFETSAAKATKFQLEFK